MAVQLRKKGSRIGVVVMIDSYNPNNAAVPSKSEFEMLSFFLGILENDSTTANHNHLFSSEDYLEKILVEMGFGELPLQQKDKVSKRIRAHLKVLSKYRPRLFEGEITFFEAGESAQKEGGLRLSKSWKKVFQGGVQITKVKGQHQTILKHPHVNQIADEISQLINKYAH